LLLFSSIEDNSSEMMMDFGGSEGALFAMFDLNPK